MPNIDLSKTRVRELNAALHQLKPDTNETLWTITNPGGEHSIAAGVDAFLTGEISEPQAHLARECGVAFLACGHHATERYGVTSLAAHVATQFGLQHVAVDIDNPA